MENQHRQIKGYRDLTQEEIDLMNLIKAKGLEIGQLVESMSATTTTPEQARWIAIGKTDLQKGFMALTRAVAQPEFF